MKRFAIATTAGSVLERSNYDYYLKTKQLKQISGVI